MPDATDIAGDFLEGDELHRLRGCLDRLQPEQRALLQQIYFDGATREAVAAETGKTVAVVKTWIRRSLAELKGCLEP